jgi:hypothetical protein
MRKKQFVKLYNQGVFGNHSPTWDTLEEFLRFKYQLDRSNYIGLCHIRNRIANGPTWYNVPCIEVEHRWKQLLKQGVSANNLYISLMAPTESTTFQGEVMLGIWGIELLYTTVALPMREALQQETKSARGIIASSLLQYFLDVNDYEWLMTLLDNFENHVVEFSVYDHCWGTLPGHRMVVWETRAY